MEKPEPKAQSKSEPKAEPTVEAKKEPAPKQKASPAPTPKPAEKAGAKEAEQAAPTPSAPKAEPKVAKKDTKPKTDPEPVREDKKSETKAEEVPAEKPARKTKEPAAQPEPVIEKTEPEATKPSKEAKPAKAKAKKPEAKPAAAPEPPKQAARKRDALKLKAEAEEARKAPAKPKDEPKPVEATAEKPKPRKRPPPKPVEDPAIRFRRLIRETGPISLAQYMGESNALYYSSRDPFGEEGDFITAPEISQMFGELIGLWLADLWVRAGRPQKVHYVELGPGRGTLATDALRTAGRYDLKPQVHFVEGSETLREIQSDAVPGVIHHHDLSTVPEDGPILLVANEFFDALPIHQLLRAAQGWTERMVGLDGERFVFVGGDKPMDSIVPSGWKSAPQGTLIETSPAAAAIMSELADRLVAQGGAALVIDYGGLEHRAGSSLQALKAHKKVDPLAMPGQADITAHVDFEMLGQVAKRQGAKLMGTVMQGDWLTSLGIETRAEALQRKEPTQAAVVARQKDRLISESEMGLLFKVMGVAAPDWPDGVGF